MARAIDDMYDIIIEELYSWQVAGPEALGPAAGTFHTALLDDAAVAAATVGAIAVVGPKGENIPVVITKDQLRAYVPSQGHKVTNEAMKYLRDFVGEKDVPGKPRIRAVEVTTAHQGGGLSIPTMTQPIEDRQWRRHGLHV